MIAQTNKNIFDSAGELLLDHKFSLALKLASDGARKFKLYQDYKHDFTNIRFLAYAAHDFALAAEKLALLLRSLSDEISTGERI